MQRQVCLDLAEVKPILLVDIENGSTVISVN